MSKTPWNNWYHVTGSTYGAWLRGDPRGWRARHHREHCVGDYKNPPPPGTYADLYNYSKFLMKRDAVILTHDQCFIAAEKMAQALLFHDVEIIDLCVTPTHFHVLCRFIGLADPGIAIPGRGIANPLSSKNRAPRHLIGIAKKESARALSKRGLSSPGGIWAVRCRPKPIRDRRHQIRVARYIHAHHKREGIVYSLHIKPRT
jgi:hypothetical protein